MTKEEVAYEKDGLQIIIRGENTDARIELFKTIVQNLLVIRKIKRDLDKEGVE